MAVSGHESGRRPVRLPEKSGGRVMKYWSPSKHRIVEREVHLPMKPKRVLRIPASAPCTYYCSACREKMNPSIEECNNYPLFEDEEG